MSSSRFTDGPPARKPMRATMIKALLAVGRVIAVAHDRWRARATPRRPMLVELAVARERIARLENELRLLRGRFSRLHPRRRPHYTAPERLDVLWHAARHGLSVVTTARAFIVSRQTVVHWR